MAASCCAAPSVPTEVQGWLRCGWAPPFPSGVLPAATHPPDLYSDFLLCLVLPSDQVPVFSSIQALPHSVIQTLIKTPLVTHLKPFLHLGEVKRLKHDGEQAVIKNVIYSAC